MRTIALAGSFIWQRLVITTCKCESSLNTCANKKDIILYNGLVKKAFRLTPNVVCNDYKNMSTGQQRLRAVMPEAVININGKEYNVGTLCR